MASLTHPFNTIVYQFIHAIGPAYFEGPLVSNCFCLGNYDWAEWVYSGSVQLNVVILRDWGSEFSLSWFLHSVWIAFPQRYLGLPSFKFSGSLLRSGCVPRPEIRNPWHFFPGCYLYLFQKSCYFCKYIFKIFVSLFCKLFQVALQSNKWTNNKLV